MSYSGGRLTPWFDSGPVRTFCRASAASGGQRLRTRVRENTPIHTGHLRESYVVDPVVVMVDARGRKLYESRVFTEVSYAPFVEHGTGLWGPKHAKYVILPKDPDGWLHWVDPKTGQDVYAKKVMHPGSPGNHMFVLGAGKTEAEIPEFVEMHLRRFVREVEQQNRTGRRV